MEVRFDLSGICLLSEGHSAASINQVFSAFTTEHTLSPGSSHILYNRQFLYVQKTEKADAYKQAYNTKDLCRSYRHVQRAALS